MKTSRCLSLICKIYCDHTMIHMLHSMLLNVSPWGLFSLSFTNRKIYKCFKDEERRRLFILRHGELCEHYTTLSRRNTCEWYKIRELREAEFKDVPQASAVGRQAFWSLLPQEHRGSMLNTSQAMDMQAQHRESHRHKKNSSVTIRPLPVKMK